MVCQCLHGGTARCSPYCPLGSCPQVRGADVVGAEWEGLVCEGQGWGQLRIARDSWGQLGTGAEASGWPLVPTGLGLGGRRGRIMLSLCPAR